MMMMTHQPLDEVLIHWNSPAFFVLHTKHVNSFNSLLSLCDNKILLICQMTNFSFSSLQLVWKCFEGPSYLKLYYRLNHSGLLVLQEESN